MTPRLTHKFTLNDYSAKEAVANYCSTSLFFFAGTQNRISHENLEKIFTKTYRKAVPWTYKIVLIIFVRGKCESEIFPFKQPSQTDFFFQDTESLFKLFSITSKCH